MAMAGAVAQPGGAFRVHAAPPVCGRTTARDRHRRAARRDRALGVRRSCDVRRASAWRPWARCDRSLWPARRDPSRPGVGRGAPRRSRGRRGAGRGGRAGGGAPAGRPAAGRLRLGARLVAARFGYVDPVGLLRDERPPAAPAAPLGRAPRGPRVAAPPRPLATPRPRPVAVARPGRAEVPVAAWAGLVVLAAGVPLGTIVHRSRRRRRVLAAAVAER